MTSRTLVDSVVLTSLKVENGSRNHEVVPTPLITQLSGLRAGSGVNKSISALAKVNLIAKVKNARCKPGQPRIDRCTLDSEQMTATD